MAAFDLSALRRRARLRRSAARTSTAAAAGASRAWTWHEAADTRALPSAAPSAPSGRPGLDRQLGRRASARAELQEFLLEPVRALGLRARRLRRALSRRTRWRRWPRRHRATAAGCRTSTCPPVFARHPRDRARAAPPLCRGAARHPDHPRRSRRSPAASRWSRRPGTTRGPVPRRAGFPGARATARRCSGICGAVLERRRPARIALAAHGRRDDPARATPARIASMSCLRSSPTTARRRAAAPRRWHEARMRDRVLRLEPGLRVLERRRDLLPRHALRRWPRAATRSRSTSPTPSSASSTATSTRPGLGARRRLPARRTDGAARR